jgi:hypothetical protein
MTDLIVAPQADQWRKLKALVLDSVSSPITKRVCNLGLDDRIEQSRYLGLKTYLGDLAVHRNRERLEEMFGRLPFEPYAPVRGQLHCIFEGGEPASQARTLRDDSIIQHSGTQASCKAI